MLSAVVDPECESTQEPDNEVVKPCVTMFVLAMVTVPGGVPIVVTSGKHTIQLPDNPTSSEVCAAVGRLTDETLAQGATQVATEVRTRFAPHNQDDATG